jgi:citrate synthase
MPVKEKVKISKGLKNVYFDRTATGSVDPAGVLLYRGYNIHDLAEHSSFEETSYLLLNGALPTRTQLEQFDARCRASRELPSEILEIIRLSKSAHPMDVLRTAVSAMSGFDPDALDKSPAAVSSKGLRLAAAAPTIVAAHARIRDGGES